MNGPAWLAIARQDIGTRETLGPNDSPWIRKMWAKLSGMWLLGQPWCGGAVAYWLTKCGISIPKAYFRARAWEDWGKPLAAPVVGCIVVFTRQGGGHVGFVVGQDRAGNLLVLGGNQGDEVNIRAFPRSRVTAYRWPAGVPAPVAPGPLPLLASAALSTREA